MLTIHNDRSVFRPKQLNVEEKALLLKRRKEVKLNPCLNYSCQQSKNWLLLTALVSLDEATECFVVLKFLLVQP